MHTKNVVKKSLKKFAFSSKLFMVSNVFFSMETLLIEAFEKGGWTLLFVIALGWVGRELYKKISAKFDELNDKVDSLRTQVTDLKVNSERYLTAIKMCDSPSCRAKKLLEEETK